MKALALIESPAHVCYRYRLEAFAGALAERGIDLHEAVLAKHALPRVAQLRATRSADAVILQRRLLPRWQLAMLRRAARVLVYDVDDALFQRDSYSRKGPDSATRRARFAATVRAADLVIAGNEYLAARVAEYAATARVEVIPTCVEPARYSVAAHTRVGADARLVWIGQQSMLPSLTAASEQLSAVAAQCNCELRVICDVAPTLPGVRVALRPWTSATETAELAAADIGVSWLPDDDWSRGKCGLKVLQYMAAGLPVVANPVGMHGQLVVDGATGFLAATQGEWAVAVARLAADPALRLRMGRAGREMVENRYSVDVWGPRLAALLHRSGIGFASVAGQVTLA
jgi:glycosyltransferase involved in cell wall biosynthesis